MDKIFRGDVVRVDLGERNDQHIQFGVRPVVVVSNDNANKHGSVLTVVPLTKVFKKMGLPVHILILKTKDNNLEKNSIALCEQITPINKSKVIKKIGKISEEDLKNIVNGVKIHIGDSEK